MQLEHALVLETVRVTERAALAASHWVGKGNEHEIDQAATQAMRDALNTLDIEGTVVIGEGEMDEAPMLYIGEKMGSGARHVIIDIAVDPVEGTTVAAKGLPNGIAVIAIAESGGLLHAPDIYMDKLVVPPPAAGRVHLDWPIEKNLVALAASLERSIEDLTIVILDRERHKALIEAVRDAGARVKLIAQGDVIASLAAAMRGTGVHAVMGWGGAPEGVITAAALKCLGGEIQGRFMPESDEQRQRLRGMGLDETQVYSTADLAPGQQLVFSATGLTDGELLQGVRRFGGGARTHSVVMGYASRVVRFIDSVHLEEDGARVTVRA
ncbi:class II fructose-bisphosphatase [Deinococcus sp. QL22]|uniref:class II fructose-bisphosphatase n=1 Tax=Deinococcus sp. QL22 TaxID=2939437 RepID=UPI0020174EC5|nr:class II fructose-bisphosphatase [Deinococcus sp. QL22]UQN10722.1 class II fructose-bisphosphatase [Deinococcus sp. QL22]